MSDEEFIKLAYKKGRVREVEQAFIDFPPELEWHEGKIENVLKDKKAEYSPYSIGDIVFVNKYFYSTGVEGKNHLFVIINKDNLAVPIEYFGMLISSQLEKLKYNTNLLLNKDDKNGLNKDSIVKIDEIYKIESNQILFKIGTVDEEKVAEYKKAYLDFNK